MISLFFTYIALQDAAGISKLPVYSFYISASSYVW